MFLLLPFIYFINKTGHTINEAKNFFKLENARLTPGIKKRGYFKTISKISNIDVIDERENKSSSLSQFPSKRIEEIVDDIIDEVIKYYILPYAEANNWKFKSTEGYLKKFLKKFISEIVRRMSTIEWNSFFCNTVLDNIKSHIHYLKSRNNQVDESNQSYFVGSRTEQLFVEAVSNRVLRSVLEERIIQCELVYHLCLGLLAHQVVKRTVEYYCDPVTQNQFVFQCLVQQRLASSKLSKQMPLFQYDMSFEEFYKMIESITDIKSIYEIKQKLVKEYQIIVFTQNMGTKIDGKKQGSDKNKVNRKIYKGHLMTERDLKCYSNQLSTLLDTVNKKFRQLSRERDGNEVNSTLTKSIKRHSTSRRNSKSEKQTISKKFKLRVPGHFNKDKRVKSTNEKVSALSECIPYKTVLENSEGRKIFKEFLNTTSYSRTVELIEMVNQFLQHPEDQHVIAHRIVKRYIHSSPPAFQFDKQLIKEMEEFLKGNANEKVFLKAKIICEEELKHRWYPYFLLSPHYKRFSKHLNKELNSIDSRKLMDMSLPDMSTDTGDTDLDSNASSDESENIIPLTTTERIIEDNGVDDDNPQLLFDFTSSLSKNNHDENPPSLIEEIEPSKQNSDTFEGHSDEEYDEEDDGYVKPLIEEIPPDTSGYVAVELFNQKLRKLDKKIEVKEKAYNACIEIFNQMPLSKKEKSKMKTDLTSLREDLNRLKGKRNQYQHDLSRINKWRMSEGNWNAVVYEVVLPEPKRGTSLDLNYISSFNDSKAGSMITDRDDVSIEDDTKQVLIVIMVSMTSTVDQENVANDNGWLIKHTLKDFQVFKRELVSIFPGVDKISLPKIPQRLFMRRKYTDNDLSHIKECLDKFITFVIQTPVLVESETVFKFFCPIESSQVSNEDTLVGPLSSLANTISDASAKVMLMAKIPSKIVQKVLAPRKHSGSVTSLDGESTDSKSDKRNTFRRISGASHIGGSMKHKMRKLSYSKDISMSAFELLEELIQLRKSLTLTRRSMITFVQSFFGKNLTQILTEKVAWIKSESTVFVCLQKYRDSFRTESSISTQISEERNVDDGEIKLPPSASAFMMTPILDRVDSNLQMVNSNSSPTMNKTRLYQKTDGGSCENLSFQGSQSFYQMETDATLGKGDINFSSSWTYSIKCDEAVKRLLWDSVPEYWKTLFGTMSVADSVGFVFESMQSLEANKALVYRILQSFVDELLEEHDEILYMTE